MGDPKRADLSLDGYGVAEATDQPSQSAKAIRDQAGTSTAYSGDVEPRYIEGYGCGSNRRNQPATGKNTQTDPYGGLRGPRVNNGHPTPTRGLSIAYRG